MAGRAHLSFDLPARPRIYFPPAGATGVTTSDLSLIWLADRNAARAMIPL